MCRLSETVRIRDRKWFDSHGWNEIKEREAIIRLILKMQQTLHMKIRPKLRLGEIERLIKKHRIIVPPLSRQTLIRMCEEGIFETAGNAAGRSGWLVFEDSFLKWVEELDGESNS